MGNGYEQNELGSFLKSLQKSHSATKIQLVIDNAQSRTAACDKRSIIVSPPIPPETPRSAHKSARWKGSSLNNAMRLSASSFCIGMVRESSETRCGGGNAKRRVGSDSDAAEAPPRKAIETTTIADPTFSMPLKFNDESSVPGPPRRPRRNSTGEAETVSRRKREKGQRRTRRTSLQTLPNLPVRRSSSDKINLAITTDILNRAILYSGET